MSSPVQSEFYDRVNLVTIAAGLTTKGLQRAFGGARNSTALGYGCVHFNHPSGELMGSAVAVANPWTTRILAALQESVAAILKVGHLLIEAKKDLPHGEFQKMVERDLPFSPRQAQIYMRVAASPQFSNAKHASHLPPAINTLDLLGRLSAQEFERRLSVGDIHPNMSRKDANTLLKGEQPTLFDDGGFFLSGVGRGLEAAIEQDEFAPYWLKLDSTSTEIIAEIVAAIRIMKKLADRIEQTDGRKKFQAEFYKMERRVTGLAEEYRRTRLNIQNMLAAADKSLRHVREV